MTAHNFHVGNRVKYKNAEGVVAERGKPADPYVVVDFIKPVKFKKKFSGKDIEKLKSA